MPNELWIFERRDDTNREALGNAALTMCRAWRAREGIRSARFYWHQADTVVLWIEAEEGGFNSPAGADYLRAGFELADLARTTLYLRMTEPRTGEEQYRAAGR